MNSAIIKFLLSHIPDGHSRIKNFYTSEIIGFIALANLIGYITFSVSVFFFDSIAMSGGVAFCVISTSVFLYLVAINNKFFLEKKEVLSSLIASKSFEPINAYSLFYNNIKELLLGIDVNYIGSIGSEVVLRSDIPALFNEIFGNQFEKQLEVFLRMNGNVILFAKNISKIDHEVLLRYYLTKSNG